MKTRKSWTRGVIAGLVLVLGLLVFVWWRTVFKTRPPADQAPASPSTAENPPAPAPRPLPSSTLSPPSAVAPRPGAFGPPARPTTALDEAHLMERLRAIKDKDHPGAITLAREGNLRFPDSPSAPERTSILIHALALDGQASPARGEAEIMVNHYPDSSWVREVEQFTGAHRHRNLSVNDAGQIVSR